MSSDQCQQCDGKVYKNGYCVEHFVQYGQAAEATSPTAAATPSTPSAASSEPKPSPSPQGSGKFNKFGGGGNKCTLCDKTSYPAETVQYDMKPYHKDCFRCTTCKKELDAPNAAQFESKIYCKMCFQKGGYNRKQAEVKWEAKEGAATSSGGPSKFGGGGHPCTTCGKTVYAGETVQFEGRIFHPKCLLCKDCGKDCHVNEAAQFEGNVYCKRCWEKGRYSKKQVATTQNFNADKPKAAVSSRFANLGGGGNKCYTCQQTVYPAETVQYEQRPYHAKCFKCLNCNKEILQVAQAEHKGDKVYCSKCFHELGLWQATINERA